MTGMRSVDVAVLVVTSVAVATTRQRMRLRSQGSMDASPPSWSPSHLDRPDTCTGRERISINHEEKRVQRVLSDWIMFPDPFPQRLGYILNAKS